MTEQQFLNELELALSRISFEERTDILQDIKEYFTNGREDGKSDSEIAASLGSPREIADELIATPLPERVQVQSDHKLIKITESYTKVAMNINFGSLYVYPSESDDTTIELINATEKLILTAEVVGDTLTVRLKGPKIRFFSLLLIGKEVRVNVVLPKKLYSSIVMKTDNGSITAEKILGKTMKADSDNGRIVLRQIAATTLDVETDNGRIEIDKVQIDRLFTKTDNGRIELRNIDSEQVHAETDNGRIVMEYVSGKIVGKTDNGRISVITTSLDRMMDLETDNGSITLESETSPTDVTIRAKVDHGRIDVFGEKNSSTKFGNGSNLIQLSSDNGKIIVGVKQASYIS